MPRSGKNSGMSAGTVFKGIAALLITIGIFYAVLVLLTVIVKLLQG